MKKNGFLFLGVYLLAGSLGAQDAPVLQMTVSSGDFDRRDSPVSLPLDDIFLEEAAGYRLEEVTPSGMVPVAFQIDPVGDRLCWLLSGHTPAGRRRTYRLIRRSPAAPTGLQAVAVGREGGGIRFRQGDRNLLHYQYEEMQPPEGADPLYKRGGFIHPLWSPKGEVLTRVQPPDHIHHYGIWNPWTSTTFEGRQVDFWNLYKGEGTVEVPTRPDFQGGPVFGEMTARHEHIDLSAPAPRAALDEMWRIRVWKAPGDGPQRIDFSSTLHCASDSAFTINAYRYQGFGFRATEKWDDATADLLTSEGMDKSNGNGTRARWIDVRGASNFGRSGILFMTHPRNHNFPEQIRIWPTGMNEGKENVFVNFNPAQEQDWTLEPGRAYALNYRMLVYDGELPAEILEQYWQDYAHPPKVEVILNRSKGAKRVLVYTRNGEGYVHDNRAASAEALEKLGAANGFEVYATEDPAYITEENLQRYHAVILSNTNNETFDTGEQKLAFQRYIQAGGGLVGIHSASGSERQWPWFWRLMGGKFRRHPPLQQFEIKVLEPYHPATLHLPETWSWEDECYYLDQLNPASDVLLAADLTTVDDEEKDNYPGPVFGKLFPLSWCRETERGRQWYTALGHKASYYEDPNFLQHLLGGILWVLDGTDRLNYDNVSDELITD